MNLEDLRAAQTRERATDGLQELRDSFYGDVAAYIADLKEQRETAASAADDPFGDPEVQELTDKIETAEQVAEAIYERRMGKLVKQASLAAAGMPDDAGGLTDEERALYGDLVERIEENKDHVLDVIAGDAEPTDAAGDEADEDTGPLGDATAETPTDPASEPTDDSPADSSAAAAMGGGLDDADAEPAPEPDGSDAEPASDRVSADPDPPEPIADDLERVTDDEDADEADAKDADVARTKVRVTDDVGEIFGVDERPYTLEAEDIVTLPEENAKPLVEKDAAEKLD